MYNKGRQGTISAWLLTLVQRVRWQVSKEMGFIDPLVFQSDFGRGDGAAISMYGVALGVAPGAVNLRPDP